MCSSVLVWLFFFLYICARSLPCRGSCTFYDDCLIYNNNNQRDTTENAKQQIKKNQCCFALLMLMLFNPCLRSVCLVCVFFSLLLSLHFGSLDVRQQWQLFHCQYCRRRIHFVIIYLVHKFCVRQSIEFVYSVDFIIRSGSHVLLLQIL